MDLTITATLRADQFNAIKAWAKLHGRNWKAPLRDAWMEGDYQGFHDSHLLQQVRNTFGPSWLVRFVLPKDGGYTVFDDPKTAAAAEQSGMVL